MLLGFISRSAAGSSAIEGLQQASWSIMGSGLEAGADTGAAVSGWSGKRPGASELTEELVQLRAEVAVLRTKLAELETTGALSAALPEYSSAVQPLKNLGPLANHRRDVLWVRLAPGVSLVEGQTIIGSEGYLGRVEEIQHTVGKPTYATVQLLSDAKSNVGARNSRTEELGVVRFSEGLDAVVFQPSSSAPTLKVGDEIVTSGLRGSTIIEGLPLGTVASLTTDRQGERVAILDLAQRSTTEPLVFAMKSTSTNWSGTP